MGFIIDLKKKSFKMIFKRKELLVIFLAVVLSTVGIKASDKLLNKEEGLVDGECEKGMVFVPSSTGGFCIDKYEVSANNDCPYSNPQTQQETRFNIENSDCESVSVEGALPWTNVSQDQAALICSKSGKRLPSSEEWYLAALGTPDKNKDWGAEDCQVDSNWGAQPGIGGSASNCVSSVGAYDMIGNVWEWTKETVNSGKFNGNELPESGYIDSTDGEGMPGETNPDTPNENYYHDYFWLKTKGVKGVARGGYWNNASDAGQYATYAVSSPSFSGVGVGFRCVR